MNDVNLEKRRATIINLINRKGSVSFSEIKESFPDVSEVTIRKDLRALDEKKLIIRTHGGAKSMTMGLNYFLRADRNSEAKEIIARKAVNLLEPGMTIYIAAGTTCAEFAHLIPDIPLKIYSDGLYTISRISGFNNINVEILGGPVVVNAMRVEGLSVIEKLQELRFSMAFLGAVSLNINYGFSYFSSMTASILSKAAERADKAVVLLDSSKVDESFNSFNIPFDDVDIVVSDGKLDRKLVDELVSKGIQVI